MKVKAIIIEDEITACNHLKRLLKGQSVVIDILAEISTAKEAITWLNSNEQPDLIFMDIQLSDGLSFKILDEVTITCPIIFTTSYDQYALKAFKTTGIEYLLKPITETNVEQAINKFVKQYQSVAKEWIIEHVEVLQELKKLKGEEFKKRFLLKKGSSYYPIDIDEIAYFNRDELVQVTLKDGTSYIVDESLNELQKTIDPKQFIRLSRAMLVSISSIKKLKPFKPGQYGVDLEPSFKEDIFLSQKRSSWVKKRLEQDL